MKLLAKYNRVNVITTIIALLVSGLCYYFIIRYELIDQLDDDLKVEEQEIIDYVKANNSLPNPSDYEDQKISFEPAAGGVVKKEYANVDIFSREEHETVSYRQLIFPITAAGKSYKVTIGKSEEKTNDLIQMIALITLIAVSLLLAVLFMVNRFLLNKLWHPFNSTLNELKQFNLSNKKSLQLADTDINEFADLNNAVRVMGTRASNDYEALKNFTENASHEIQTPLAIIRSKLELLMQSDSLKEEQIKHIQSIDDASNRLSKLNQSLILLTKIDNNQFQEKEEINLAMLIDKLSANYDELIAAKLITVTKKMDPDCTIIMNETMAEILVSNLITNAIKHNIEKGFIEIILTADHLIVRNTGSILTSNPVKLFERFRKDKPGSDSLGLGLSIVKKICERYGYAVGYDYADSLHIMSITFH